MRVHHTHTHTRAHTHTHTRTHARTRTKERIDADADVLHANSTAHHPGDPSMRERNRDCHSCSRPALIQVGCCTYPSSCANATHAHAVFPRLANVLVSCSCFFSLPSLDLFFALPCSFLSQRLLLCLYCAAKPKTKPNAGTNCGASLHLVANSFWRPQACLLTGWCTLLSRMRRATCRNWQPSLSSTLKPQASTSVATGASLFRTSHSPNRLARHCSR